MCFDDTRHLHPALGPGAWIVTQAQLQSHFSLAAEPHRFTLHPAADTKSQTASTPKAMQSFVTPWASADLAIPFQLSVAQGRGNDRAPAGQVGLHLAGIMGVGQGPAGQEPPPLRLLPPLLMHLPGQSGLVC